MKVSVSEFINSLTDLDPDYVGVPDNVDLSGATIWMMERSASYGYNYPDGVYWDRSRSRFEELVTVAARYTT